MPVLITQDVPQWTQRDAVVQIAEVVEWSRPDDAEGLVKCIGSARDQVVANLLALRQQGRSTGTLGDIQDI